MTLGHARNTAIPVTSFRTGFRALSSNPQQFPASCIHSNNNSVDRIISKEEEREDPRRDSSIYLRVQNTVVFPQIIQELQDSFEYSVFYSVSTRNPATPSNSAYRINSSTRNTTTTRLIPCRLLPATVPRVSKHSTRQNKAPGFPTAFQGHTA